MKDLYVIQHLVEDELVKHPETRNSDTILYLAIIDRINPTLKNKSFGYVMCNARSLGLPNIKSVERARRKIQENNSLLRPTEKVLDNRYELFKEFRDYART